MLELLQTALGEQWRPDRMRLKYVSGENVAGNEFLSSLNVKYGAPMIGVSIPIEKLSAVMPEVYWDRRGNRFPSAARAHAGSVDRLATAAGFLLLSSFRCRPESITINSLALGLRRNDHSIRGLCTTRENAAGLRGDPDRAEAEGLHIASQVVRGALWSDSRPGLCPMAYLKTVLAPPCEDPAGNSRHREPAPPRRLHRFPAT